MKSSIIEINGDLEELKLEEISANINDIWNDEMPNGQQDIGTDNKENNEKILFYKSNSNESEVYLSKNHPFLNAFYYAYSNHLSLSISPDDVWFQIISEFAELINENAEEYRDLLVEHQGKKTLKVELDSEDWNLFIHLVSEKINKETKTSLTDDLVTKFSNSTEFDLTLQKISVMHSVQQYFRYEFEISCGIRYIELTGEISDWELIVQKTRNLKNKYEKICGKWLSKLIPVLEEFVKTKKGDVNKGFWNKVMRKDFNQVGLIRGGYGNEKINYITGWIRYFFPKYMRNNRLEDNSFSKILLNCPVHVDRNGKESVCYLKGTFIGCEYKDGWISPVRSYCVSELVK
jgi:hypothetical protein